MRPTSDTRRPSKSILDPSFRYTPSHCTNVRGTFERARRAIEEARAAKPGAATVVQLTRREQS